MDETGSSAGRLPYREWLDRVVQFHSRARGDARSDSNHDLALFLKEPLECWLEIKRLCELYDDFLDDDAFIDTKPYPANRWSARTPSMRKIHRNGIEMCPRKHGRSEERRVGKEC